VREKYPNRVPCIVRRAQREYRLGEIDKSKYLVPCDLTFGQFMFVLRQRLQVKPFESLFAFVNNHTLVAESSLMSQIDKQHKDTDGFLHIFYATENSFG
jgi:GABA(A) receptor-associated protein